MKRKIDDYLLNWKNNRNNGLIVYGARQIGKSYSIEYFIRDNYTDYLIVDFAKRPDLIPLFESFTDLEDFYRKLSFLTDVKENLILFFDEIQELYIYRQRKIEIDSNVYNSTVDLLTLTKSIVQENKNRIIFSGSMLGVTLTTVNLNPTGYMDVYNMFPMDFEEFLWANNINKSFINMLKDSYDKLTPVNDSIHNKMNHLFIEYTLVGGMPAAVLDYINNHSFSNVSIIQEGIINFYKSDILKYAPLKDKMLIYEIYSMISSEINSKNKRFTKTHLDYSNIKNLELIDKYLYLTNSGVANAVYNVANPVFPLKISEDRKVLKLFYGDVGLLSYELLGIQGRIKFLNGEIEVNYGANFENVVAQELKAHGFKDLNYFNSKKSGEVDFLIEKDTEVIPLEVKSGKSKTDFSFNHKTLDNLLYIHKNIKKAYILSRENISINERIISLPIYMIMFIDK